MKGFMKMIRIDKTRWSKLFGQPRHLTLLLTSFFFALSILYGYMQSLPIQEGTGNLQDAEKTAGEKLRTYLGQVARQDTLHSILGAQGTPPEVVKEVVAAARHLFDLNRIKAKKDYRLGFSQGGELLFLEYEIDDERFVRVEKSEGSFNAKLGEISYDTRVVTFSGSIDTSLYDAVVYRRESPMLGMQMAEIFAWDIDFNTDLRKNDSFNLVIEKKYRDGNYVKNGRILAAELMNEGRPHRAIYFEDSSGRGDYYTEDGKSLRKQFLKAPLRYSYISSGYSLNRMHPILSTIRPHQAIDYAAPQGTPVVAIGDGRVEWAGWKGWNGIIVKLKHNGTYTSAYGHLSRVAQGITEGAVVRQGQVIGYVGSTGMSTGPHLDFRIWKNDAYVNPLTIQMPPARNISAEENTAFTAIRSDMLAQLGASQGTMNARQETAITRPTGRP